MSWAKFDDQYPDHPKIIKVGPMGMALHTAATCYCARYLTDGFVPSGMINKLVNFEGIISNGNAVTNKTVTDDLTAAGLFEIVEGGYMVHDYLVYNPPAEQVKRERAENAARQAEWKKKNRNKKGQFDTNIISNTVTNTLVTTAPSPYPYPSIPNIDNSSIKVEEGAASDELDTTPVSPLDWDREEEEPFYIVKRLLETLTGIPAQGKAAIDSIDKIVEMGANGDDIRSGLKWFLDQGKPLKYYSSLVGPITTEKNKRIQSSNGHKPSEHVFNEVYQ